jgi:hypothetical protein
MPSIERVLEGRQLFAVGFWEQALSAWPILLLKHTFRNVICILELLHRGQEPPIESVLEGRQFVVVGFLGVSTMGMAGITVVTHLQEYIVYSRTIKQQVDAPDPMGARGQAVVRSWIFGDGDYGHG